MRVNNYKKRNSMDKLSKRSNNRNYRQTLLSNLEDSLPTKDHSNESLVRLSRVLRDINDEVHLMKNMMKDNNK